MPISPLTTPLMGLSAALAMGWPRRLYVTNLHRAADPQRPRLLRRRPRRGRRPDRSPAAEPLARDIASALARDVEVTLGWTREQRTTVTASPR